MMTPVRLTITNLQDGLQAISGKGISGAAILWAEVCEEGDDFNFEYGVPPGSLLMGVEYMEKGEMVRGTLKFEPPAISRLLN